MARAFDHGAMGSRIDPSWGGPIELFLVPASAMVERDVAPWYEHSLMVRCVIGSILRGVDPLSYFSLQPVLWWSEM